MNTTDNLNPSLEHISNLIDKEIEQYKILNILGNSDHSFVYRALDSTSNKNVAIKFVPKSLLKNKNISHIVKLASRLQNKHFAFIENHGKYQDSIFFVTDIIEGDTLFKILENKKAELLKSARHFDIDYALRIVQEITEAIKLLHENDIIHTNLTPGNVFIEHSNGNIVITDLGLSSIQPSPYLSPEAISGSAPTKQTDIYALGMTLYTIVSGNPPYEPPNLIEKIKEGKYISISKTISDSTHNLDAIMSKATSINAKTRYSSIDMFLSDISGFLGGKHIPSQKEIVKEKKAYRSKIRAKATFIISGIIIITALCIYYKFQKKTVSVWNLTQQMELAKNYKIAGLNDKAREIYVEVIEKYPGTKYSKQSRIQLEEL